MNSKTATSSDKAVTSRSLSLRTKLVLTMYIPRKNTLIKESETT